MIGAFDNPEWLRAALPGINWSESYGPDFGSPLQRMYAYGPDGWYYEAIAAPINVLLS